MSNTPGPWRVESTPAFGNRIVHGESNPEGYADDVPFGCFDSAALGNLHLAAAAQELLEALNEAIPLMQAARRTVLLDKSMAAIAKATGGAA